MKRAWFETLRALLASRVVVANIPANPVPVLTSPTIPLGYPLRNPKNTASPKLWEIPAKMLATIATANIHDISLLKQASAIPLNDTIVKIATKPTLVVCLMLTQQAPLTSLEDAPNKIMKNRKRPMNDYCPKASARSEAAA